MSMLLLSTLKWNYGIRFNSDAEPHRNKYKIDFLLCFAALGLRSQLLCELSIDSNIVYLSITQSRLLFFHKFYTLSITFPSSHMAFDAMMSHRSSPATHPVAQPLIEVHKIVIDICEQQEREKLKGGRKIVYSESMESRHSIRWGRGFDMNTNSIPRFTLFALFARRNR